MKLSEMASFKLLEDILASRPKFKVGQPVTYALTGEACYILQITSKPEDRMAQYIVGPIGPSGEPLKTMEITLWPRNLKSTKSESEWADIWDESAK